jgi:anti-anti-sigma factor
MRSSVEGLLHAITAPMEISITQRQDALEFRLCGRLDANWSDYVSKAIDDAVRAGSHRIELHFSQVHYISSAGLRVLFKFYKVLKAVHGSLTITEPSEAAYKILRLAGFDDMMLAAPAAAALAPVKAEALCVEKNGSVFHVFDHSPGAQLYCSLIGNPEKLFDTGFQEGDCTRVSLPRGTFGLGLGAFGGGFHDCRERFGEFLAMAGTATTLPTDGSNVPDFVVSQESLVPELWVLYAVTGRGEFARMLRFDAKPEAPGVISLSSLVDAAMEISDTNAVGVVLLAESSGLVGAALRRSPGRADAGSPLDFPGIRDWLSFTTERTSERNLTLIAGIAVREPPAGVSPFVRRLSPNAPVHGHFHAAVFPYRPVQRGELHLEAAIGGLMAVDNPRKLLHLLTDDRGYEGLGQSDLMRGACWIGPIAEFQNAGHVNENMP